jgi:2-polyprenyl-3-methyl-5-hydroxy-6-metoxy-1,4-benzoquinol methylase
MLAGVPAMGLGYEDKTEQIFRQMGLEVYQARFDRDAQTWIETADTFIGDVNLIRDRLANALDERCKAANDNILVVEEQLSTISPVITLTPEQRWSSSVRRYGRPHLRLRQVAMLANELHPRRMLDVGCATGQLRLLCPDVEYVGCDFIAPSSPIEFSFHQCNFNREPLPTAVGDFDVVVCSGILEYIENPSEFLKSLRSMLKTEGHLIVTYFNMNHISRLWRMALGHSFPVHPDWRGFHSPRDIRKVIEKSGFQILKSIPMNHAIGKAVAVEETVDAPLKLPGLRWWSPLLAHQFLFLAKASISKNRHETTKSAALHCPR